GDDDQMVNAILGQASAASQQDRPLDELGVLDAAEAIVARTHVDREAKIATVRGDALTQAGRHPEAIEELKRAVALYEQKAPSDPVAERGLGAAVGAVASAFSQSFHYAEARDILLRVEQIESKLLGPEHPELAKTLHDLGDDESRLGNPDKGIAYQKRAREIF